MSDSPSPPPAWYLDPVDPARWRYWDGSSWTSQLRSAPTVAVDPTLLPPPRPAPIPGPARASSRRAAGAVADPSRRGRLLRSPVAWVLAVLIAAAMWLGWQSAQHTVEGPTVVIVPQPTQE